MLEPIDIARVAHNIVDDYKGLVGLNQLGKWESINSENKELSLHGVNTFLETPNLDLSSIHTNWANQKTMHGWTYGQVWDEELKTHPNLVSYETLPKEVQAIDGLYKAITNNLSPYIDNGGILKGESTKISEETEITVFGRLDSFEPLNEFNEVEDHIQLETKFSNGKKARVRKTIKNGEVDYELTFKSNKSISGDVQPTIPTTVEHTIKVDSLIFDYFKTVCEKAFYKKRYTQRSKNVQLVINIDEETQQTIELPELLFQIDVYEKQSGGFSQWCKIDIEIDKIKRKIKELYPDCEVSIAIKLSLKNLPINLLDSIIKETADKVDLEIIDNLFKDEYRTTLKLPQ